MRLLYIYMVACHSNTVLTGDFLFFFLLENNNVVNPLCCMPWRPLCFEIYSSFIYLCFAEPVCSVYVHIYKYLSRYIYTNKIDIKQTLDLLIKRSYEETMHEQICEDCI